MTEPLITTIDLLRHGEAEGGPCYRGSRDDALTRHGWQQMAEVLGEHAPWQAIITSPLQRCAAFARQLAGQHDLPIEIVKDLREIHFGVWEGRRADDLIQQQPEALKAYWADPAANPPAGGEALADFEQRISTAWEKVIHNHSGKHLLLVSHAGTLRSLLGQLLDIPQKSRFHLNIPHACLSRVQLFHAPDNSTLPLLMFHAGKLAPHQGCVNGALE